MASSRTIYLEKKHLDQDFGAQAWVPPATLYIALFTARGTVAQAAAGTNFVEATGGGYARASVVNNLTNWAAATSTFPVVKANAVAINFGTPSVGWGTITCIGVYDSLAGGNLLYWGDLSSSYNAIAGTPVTFAIGSLRITGQVCQ